MLIEKVHVSISLGSESYSGKRVIRYEEGKEAEVFTLVIKNTVEENWFKTSNVGKSYIEISESELDEILSGKVLSNKVEEGEEIDLLFRL